MHPKTALRLINQASEICQQAVMARQFIKVIGTLDPFKGLPSGLREYTTACINKAADHYQSVEQGLVTMQLQFLSNLQPKSRGHSKGSAEDGGRDKGRVKGRGRGNCKEGRQGHGDVKHQGACLGNCRDNYHGKRRCVLHEGRRGDCYGKCCLEGCLGYQHENWQGHLSRRCNCIFPSKVAKKLPNNNAVFERSDAEAVDENDSAGLISLLNADTSPFSRLNAALSKHGSLSEQARESAPLHSSFPLHKFKDAAILGNNAFVSDSIRLSNHNSDPPCHQCFLLSRQCIQAPINSSPKSLSPLHTDHKQPTVTLGHPLSKPMKPESLCMERCISKDKGKSKGRTKRLDNSKDRRKGTGKSSNAKRINNGNDLAKEPKATNEKCFSPVNKLNEQDRGVGNKGRHGMEIEAQPPFIIKRDTKGAPKAANTDRASTPKGPCHIRNLAKEKAKARKHTYGVLMDQLNKEFQQYLVSQGYTQGDTVNFLDVKEKALQLSKIKTFKASRSWFRRFCLTNEYNPCVPHDKK